MLSKHFLMSAQTFRVGAMMRLFILAHHYGAPSPKGTSRRLSRSYKLEQNPFLRTTKTGRGLPHSSNSSGVVNVNYANLCWKSLCERKTLQATVDGMRFYNERSYERF